MTLLRSLSLVMSLAGALCAAAFATKSFSLVSRSNRYITPNGDGMNDTVIFSVSNPRFSDVTGKVYDRHGGLVSDMTVTAAKDELAWDGKSGGRAVPGGLYVYIIESEGQVLRGLLVVVR